MNVYELRIRGLREEPTLYAVRWALFVHPEVRDVVRAVRPETVVVLYEREAPEPEAWCRTLAAAGYEAEPAALRSDRGTAA